MMMIVVLIGAHSSLLLAQDTTTTITGSGVIEPLIQELVNSAEVSDAVTINVTGTGSGFASFCRGESDLTTATRPMSTEEQAICSENEIAYFDLVVGHNIMALITHPDTAAFAACLTLDQLNTIFAPSAQGEITNWNQVLPDAPDLNLSVIVPDDFTQEYAILDDVIEGVGIRADATTQATETTLSEVSSTPGAIGIVPLPLAQASSELVTILELDAASVQGCQTASAISVEDGLYPAAQQLYLYVNDTSLEQPALVTLLEFAVGDTAAEVVENSGFVAVTDLARAANQEKLQTALTGEIAAQNTSAFEISPALVGQIAVGGAGEGITFIQTAIDSFRTLAPGATVNLQVEGLEAGARRLCNGELDFVYAYRDLTAEEIASCEANNIDLLTMELGKSAVVLLANASSDYLSCLSLDALTTIWRAGGAETISTWNQVNASYPETAITLFAPNLGDIAADRLLLAASGQSLPMRDDIQFSDDPLYRAAATANVEGALTFVSWAEYQSVLANNQQNINLAAVDGGSGCVTPDISTIQSGEYALSRQGKLIINQSQLIRSEVQSLLWHILSDENFAAYTDAGFVGVRLSDLAILRARLLAEIEAVRAAAVQAETTPEPEATAEATAEPQ
jgi:phosphate transport system substrate-binding protein